MIKSNDIVIYTRTADTSCWYLHIANAIIGNFNNKAKVNIIISTHEVAGKLYNSEIS